MEAVNYWDVHGILFLIGLMIFPRLTVIFFSAISGGFFLWAGIILFPRLFIAIFACVYYWDTNPILCLLACVLCFAGESGEKTVVAKSLS